MLNLHEEILLQKIFIIQNEWHLLRNIAAETEQNLIVQVISRLNIIAFLQIFSVNGCKFLVNHLLGIFIPRYSTNS